MSTTNRPKTEMYLEYGRGFARKAYMLNPEANYVVVNSDGSAWWSIEEPTPDLNDGRWCSPVPYLRFLGMVSNYGDWKKTLISRIDVGMEPRSLYGRDFVRRVFELIYEASYVVVDEDGVAWWYEKIPTISCWDGGVHKWRMIDKTEGKLGSVVSRGAWDETLITRTGLGVARKRATYGKDYARRIFDLLADANYIVVNGDGTAWWSDDEHPKPNLRDEKWYYASWPRFLGKVVQRGDWKETLISRKDIEGTK